ncbi:MAG TPA: metallophosphoesterase [Armatimonadota bacterium]|jgi:2',3'-cyclic-nucleotide 2'-phosphodiesterase (5'-nucleotidase family)
MARLSLLHTTDLHGCLTPEQASRLREMRRDRAALLLDSGDALTAPNVAYKPWTEPVLLRMNEAGYDAMAAGNREFYFRQRGLRRKTREAAFPVLCANLRGPDGRQLLTPSVLLTSPQGDTVGVFGLMREMIPPGSWMERLAGVRFAPWRPVAEELAAHLRPQVQWLVALSHLGPEDDEELARLCPQLDLVLGGHSHPAQRLVRRVGATTLVTGLPYLQELLHIQSTTDNSPSDFSVEAVTL